MNKFYYINITKKIIENAIEIYNELGPGLSKNSYLQSMIYKLNKNKFSCNLSINLPLKNKNLSSSIAYLFNIIIDNKIIVEILTEEKILPIHERQLLSSMKSTKIELGLLLNFKKMLINDGIRILIFQNNKKSQSQYIPNSFE